MQKNFYFNIILLLYIIKSYIVVPIFKIIKFTLVRIIGGGFWFFISLTLMLYFLLEHSVIIFNDYPEGLIAFLSTQPVIFDYILPPFCVIVLIVTICMALIAYIIRQLNALIYIFLYVLPLFILNRLLLIYFCLYQIIGNKSHPSIIIQNNEISNTKFYLSVFISTFFIIGLTICGIYYQFESNKSTSSYGNFSYENKTYVTYEDKEILPFIIINGSEGYYMNVTAVLDNSVIYIEDRLKYFYQINETGGV